MQKYIATAIKKDVNNPEPKGETPAVNVDVFVRLLNDSLATIYSDNGVTTITQPLKTDSKGRVEFYAANDRYKIIYDLPSGQISDVDIILEDPGDRKATQQQAIDGTNDSQFMTPLKTHESFNQYGFGDGAVDVPNTDLNTLLTDGFYHCFGTNFPSVQIPNAPYENMNFYLQVISLKNTQFLLQQATSVFDQTARTFIRVLSQGVFLDWFELYSSSVLDAVTNNSGATVSNGATVAGSNLIPSKFGTWRNVSGNDIANNSLGLFKKV